MQVFLGYKQYEYFPSSWLAYRVLEKEGLPLEGDDVSDLDVEPVGQIDWPLPERNAAHHLHALYGASPGLTPPGTSSSLSLSAAGNSPAFTASCVGELHAVAGPSMGHAYSAGDLIGSSGSGDPHSGAAG